MQRAQGHETFLDDGHRDPRFEARLLRPRRRDDVVDVLPAAIADAVLDPSQRLLAQQPPEIETVHPFHQHHADPVMVHEVLDRQQIVLLDPRDQGGDVGDSLHGFVVAPPVVIPLGRKHLDGHGHREPVRAAVLGQVHDALSARTQPAREMVVHGPREIFQLEQTLIPGQQFCVGVPRIGTTVGHRGMKVVVCRGQHIRIPEGDRGGFEGQAATSRPPSRGARPGPNRPQSAAEPILAYPLAAIS